MANSVDCPKCARSFQVPSELLGKRMRCLQCQHVFVAEIGYPLETALQSEPSSPRRSVELAKDDRPPPPRSSARFKRDTTDYSAYLWPLAALPWGLLLLALGGCIWGLLAATAAAILSGLAVALVQSRRMSFGLRLGGLLAINGVAALLLVCGGVTVAFLLSSNGKNGPGSTTGPSAPFSQQQAQQRGADNPPPAPEVKLPPVKPLFERGARVYLADVKEFGVMTGPWPFGKQGKINDGRPISLHGKLSPKGLVMHPPEAPGFSSVRYRLGKQAALFRAVAAINDTTQWCWSPATFSVLGDGKLLWKSVRIAHNHTHSQDCEVDISDVDVLELRVQCENGNQGIHAVWIEPRLLQKADTPDQ